MDIRAGMVALIVLGAAFAVGYICGKIDQRNIYLPMLKEAWREIRRAERRAAQRGRETWN